MISLQRHVTPSKFASPYRFSELSMNVINSPFQNTKHINTPTENQHVPKNRDDFNAGRHLNQPLIFQGFHGGISKHIQPKNHAPEVPNAPRLDSFIHQAQRSGRRIVLMTFSSMPVGERTGSQPFRFVA